MADFNEHIRIVVSSIADVTGIKAFKTAVSEADGVLGKIRAGAGSVFSTISANAGTFALVVGAALVKWGIDSEAAFDKVALAARNLSAATGLSVEDASRWNGVAKDMGISADTLYFGLSRIAKTIDDTKWAGYGISTRDAGGEARSINAILLDTAGVLSSVTNESQKSAIGNDLFGRGYSKISPILEQGRASLEAYLGSVEKGQVITADELAKAEASVKANKDLKQSFQEVGLSVGQLVTSLAPVIEGLAKVVIVAGNVVSFGVNYIFATKGMTSATEKFAESLPKMNFNDTIHGFIALAQESGNARSNIDKATGTWDEWLGITSNVDLRNSDLTKSFEELLNTSPKGAASLLMSLRELVTQSNTGDEAAKHFTQTYGIAADTLNSFQGKLDAVTQAQESGIMTTKQRKAAEADLKAAQDDAKATLDAYNLAIQEETKRQQEINKVIDDAKKKNDDYRKSIDDVRKAHEDSISTIGNFEQSLRDTEDAWQKVLDKQAEEIKTAKDKKATDADKAQSTRDVASAQHDFLNQLLATSQAYADSRGDIKGSEQAHLDEIAVLENAKAKYPELAAQIDVYIQALKNIPPTVDSNVKLHINAHLDNITVDGETHAAGVLTINTKYNVLRTATGNPNFPGGFTTTSEQGKEAIWYPPGTKILGASQTANMEQAGGGGNGSYIDQSVTHIYMPPGLDPEAYSRAGREYKRRGGR